MQRQPQHVPLDVNSLYICTTSLLNDVFHWAFIHIDKDKTATQHHWVARNPNLIGGPEGYLDPTVLVDGPQDTSRRAPGGIPVLTFFKVIDYCPMSVADFKARCKAVFPQSWPTVQQNHQAGISCRTWGVLGVLASILGDARAHAIVKAVSDRSTIFNNTRAADLMFSRYYEAQVVALPEY